MTNAGARVGADPATLPGSTEMNLDPETEDSAGDAAPLTGKRVGPAVTVR